MNSISSYTFRKLAQTLISGFGAGWLAITLSFALLSPATIAQTSSTKQDSQAYGIEAKRPVFAGACHYCPYGAMADVVKAAMKPYRYDVQICYRCSTTIGIRQISEARIPPQPKPRPEGEEGSRIMGPVEPVPTGPMDFGAVNSIVLHRAYNAAPGRGDFDKEPPHKNLRVFAVVDYPLYTIVAATKESGITDLAQLKARKKPLHVVVDHHRSMEVLAYYGLTRESIEAAGGSVLSDNDRGENFDLVIFDGTLSNAPEQDVWYALTQAHDLVFLQMADELVEQLAKAPGYEMKTMPLGLMRGLDRNIATVSRSRYTIIGRDDAPDDFAYTVARALDEQQDLWMQAPIPLYYNPQNAWKTEGIPLHPGAERYYREKGYLK